MPGFQSFYRFLHYFVLGKLASSSIRVNQHKHLESKFVVSFSATDTFSLTSWWYRPIRTLAVYNMFGMLSKQRKPHLPEGNIDSITQELKLTSALPTSSARCIFSFTLIPTANNAPAGYHRSRASFHSDFLYVL